LLALLGARAKVHINRIKDLYPVNVDFCITLSARYLPEKTCPINKVTFTAVFKLESRHQTCGRTIDKLAFLPLKLGGGKVSAL
jgi:hypothetical protein